MTARTWLLEILFNHTPGAATTQTRLEGPRQLEAQRQYAAQESMRVIATSTVAQNHLLRDRLQAVVQEGLICGREVLGLIKPFVYKMYV
jgi:hypothetical protein